jgi:hypothetical protein
MAYLFPEAHMPRVDYPKRGGRSTLKSFNFKLMYFVMSRDMTNFSNESSLASAMAAIVRNQRRLF